MMTLLFLFRFALARASCSAPLHLAHGLTCSSLELEGVAAAEAPNLRGSKPVEFNSLNEDINH